MCVLIIWQSSQSTGKKFGMRLRRVDLMNLMPILFHLIFTHFAESVVCIATVLHVYVFGLLSFKLDMIIGTSEFSFFDTTLSKLVLSRSQGHGKLKLLCSLSQSFPEIDVEIKTF